MGLEGWCRIGIRNSGVPESLPMAPVGIAMGILERLFGRRGWRRFPQTFVTGLQRRLGEESFQTLTELAEKYNLFGQALFARPEHLDIEDEADRTSVVGLLTSMGNALAKDEHFKDAETVFRIALCLLPEHSPARGSLAFICLATGRTDEARQHAARAIADIDREDELYKDIPVPEHIAPAEALNAYRDMLRRVANGEALDL